MRMIAVLLCTLVLSVSAAPLSCQIQIGRLGNVSGTCKDLNTAPPSNPTPTPPAPTPASCPYVPVVMQTMCIGGHNNYVYDSNNYTSCTSTSSGATSATGAIQTFPIPQTWQDGSPMDSAGFYFTSHPGVNAAEFEVVLSRCKGDFSYPDTPEAMYQGYKPCRVVYGSDMQIFFGREADFTRCKIPAGEQWYMNWRVHTGTCPAGTGLTCGQTFAVPRGG